MCKPSSALISVEHFVISSIKTRHGQDVVVGIIEDVVIYPFLFFHKHIPQQRTLPFCSASFAENSGGWEYMNSGDVKIGYKHD